jgi:DNA mismatch repair protein MutS2
VILGALAFRDRALAAGLETSLATMVDEGGPTRLAKLFNPLLLAAKSGIAPVPCDLTIEAPKSLVVVTGPNSGGKTRMLQALAYAQLLGQGGFFAPAALLELPVAGGLFVSLIDRADADQSEGRLGTELLRIRRLFESLAAVRQERARVSGSAEPLVILDELCSGTNPDEGETIFRLVVKLLGTAVRPSTFVTTHFLAFAARLEQEAERQEAAHPALEFLSVELDAEERPTYGFRRGVAKTSLAHRTAERLGVTEDALRRLLEGAASALDS